jgi:nucleotide-binding universal stress UspA family protein
MYRNPADPLENTDVGATSQTHGDAMLTAALSSLRASHPQLAVARHLVRGRPSAVLLEAAAGAGLLVVGARGVGGCSGLSLGSVALHVVANASCPVVVVRGTQRSVGPVVVGIDGSSESPAVLAAAFKEAERRGSPLCVVWALYIHSKAEGVPDPVAAQAVAEADARSALKPLLASASRHYPQLEVLTSFDVGYPAEALVNASTTARLLVIGARGGGGFVGMEIGSIAHATVHQSRCPVLVVRSTATESGSSAEGEGSRSATVAERV